jgi:hypothetical protein
LVKKLHTFAESARAVIYDGITSWAESEFPGDFAALAAEAKGGDARAQFALLFASTVSAEATEG